jgi:hypothetical protein
MACASPLPGINALAFAPGFHGGFTPTGDAGARRSLRHGLRNALRLLHPALKREGHAAVVTRRLVKVGGSARKRQETEHPGAAGGPVGHIAERRVAWPGVLDPVEMVRQLFAENAQTAQRAVFAEHLAGLHPCVRILKFSNRLRPLIAFQHAFPCSVFSNDSLNECGAPQ